MVIKIRNLLALFQLINFDKRHKSLQVVVHFIKWQANPPKWIYIELGSGNQIWIYCVMLFSLCWCWLRMPLIFKDSGSFTINGQRSIPIVYIYAWNQQTRNTKSFLCFMVWSTGAKPFLEFLTLNAFFKSHQFHWCEKVLVFIEFYIPMPSVLIVNLKMQTLYCFCLVIFGVHIHILPTYYDAVHTTICYKDNVLTCWFVVLTLVCPVNFSCILLNVYNLFCWCSVLLSI